MRDSRSLSQEERAGVRSRNPQRTCLGVLTLCLSLWERAQKLRLLPHILRATFEPYGIDSAIPPLSSSLVGVAARLYLLIPEAILGGRRRPLALPGVACWTRTRGRARGCLLSLGCMCRPTVARHSIQTALSDPLRNPASF